MAGDSIGVPQLELEATIGFEGIFISINKVVYAVLLLMMINNKLTYSRIYLI